MYAIFPFAAFQESKRADSGPFLQSLRSGDPSAIRILVSEYGPRIHLLMNEDTVVHLTGRSRMNLEKGEVWVYAIPGLGTYVIDVPGAAVQVLGTSFGLRARSEGVSVLVASGSVLFTIQQEDVQIYRVDWNNYPPMAPQIPKDPYGILGDVQLAVLTTPIAYISASPFNDPFGEIKKTLIAVPCPESPNPRTSLLYYNYYYFSQWTRNPLIDVIGIALVSIGPDRKDSFDVFRPFPETALPPLARAVGIRHPLDTEYDPTNGTVSGGDLFGFAGDMAVPQ